MPSISRIAEARSGQEQKNCLSRLPKAGPQGLPFSGAKRDAKNGSLFGQHVNPLIMHGLFQFCGPRNIVRVKVVPFLEG
jgi:hypothetical protein